MFSSFGPSNVYKTKNKAYFILESTAITTPVKTYDRIVTSHTLDGKPVLTLGRKEGSKRNESKSQKRVIYHKDATSVSFIPLRCLSALSCLT